MRATSKLTPAGIRALNEAAKAGVPQKVWEDGVGYLPKKSGNGGTWYIRYRAPIPGDFKPGEKRPRERVVERLPDCLDKAQAMAELHKRREAIALGTYQRGRIRPVTLADFVPRFLAAKRHLKSWKKYERQLTTYIVPFFGGNTPLASITKAQCREYYNTRRESDAALATVNGEVACLKTLFSEAVNADICESNPVKAVKMKTPNNRRDRTLTEEETRRLFAAADSMPVDDYTRPLFYLLFYSGMRLGEALSLEWSDVQWDHERIHVRESKTGEGRMVPLTDALAAELKRWQRHAISSRWVLPSRKAADKPLDDIRDGWDRLLENAKVPRLLRHDLRHNFVSRLQAAGVADSTIMSITGHKSYAMLHRYSHANEDARRNAVDVMRRPKNRAEVIPLRAVDKPEG